jgi:conjugative transposon TraM protein
MNQNLRKRKMLLVMPLLVIPFVTLAFYALGGGRGNEQAKISNELNLKLPSSSLKDDQALDKLSFYDKARNDSLKLAEWMRNDPYFKIKDSSYQDSGELERLTELTASKYNRQLNPSPAGSFGSRPEDEVLMKLKLLQDELDNKPAPSKEKNKDNEFNSSVDRLESMMNSMKNQDGEDPEIKQLSTVMDKILDIQHPDRVGERKGNVQRSATNLYAVRNTAIDDSSSFGFYELSNGLKDDAANASLAVIHENQILVNGSIIKLRLVQDVFVNNEKIPRGNFVFGIVTLNGERLEVKINSIRSGNSVFDVLLEVYDMDGIAGIHIPGAITRDAAKQMSDNRLQMMELNTIDPSLKAQATSAGIGAVKNLLGKKMKMVRVMVKAGYKVLLKNKDS